MRASRPSVSSASTFTSRATARKSSRRDQPSNKSRRSQPESAVPATLASPSTVAMPSDGSPNPDDDLLQRPAIGVVRCSLCGRGILKINDLAKAALRSKLALVHQRCYDALTNGRKTRPRRRDSQQRRP